MKLDELAASLVERLLLPLMKSGSVRLLPPLGEARAVELSESMPGAELFPELQALKLRRMRAWYPVDFDSELTTDEWLLLAALNDLLQLTNPSLLGPFGGVANRQELSVLIERLIDRSGAPSSVWQALSRHALFGGVVRLVRKDTSLSWWTGSREFVGTEPPARLLAWPGLRRVQLQRRSIPLAEMGGAGSSRYDVLLQRFLAATPLTAFAGSGVIPFRWTGAALGLTRVRVGRQLALRVLLAVQDVPRALNEVSRAARNLEKLHAEAARHALDFAAEALARYRQFSVPVRRAAGDAGKPHPAREDGDQHDG